MMSLCSALELKWAITSTTFDLLYILRVVRYQEEYIISDDNTCGYVDNLKSRLCCNLVMWYISKYHMLSGRYYLISRWYVGTSLLQDSTGWAKAMYVNDIWCWGGDTLSQHGVQFNWYKRYTCCDVPYDTMWLYIRIAWSDDMALGWHDMIYIYI